MQRKLIPTQLSALLICLPMPCLQLKSLSYLSSANNNWSEDSSPLGCNVYNSWSFKGLCTYIFRVKHSKWRLQIWILNNDSVRSSNLSLSKLPVMSHYPHPQPQLNFVLLPCSFHIHSTHIHATNKVNVMNGPTPFNDQGLNSQHMPVLQGLNAKDHCY